MKKKIKNIIKLFIPNKILEIEPQIKLIGFYEFFVGRRIRKKFLLNNEKLKKEILRNDSVNIIIAIRNICDYKIRGTIKSIKLQDYPSNLLKITLVDYGSGRLFSNKLKKLCEKNNVNYIYKSSKSWEITKAFNIGIKDTKEKYILISQPDIIFEKNYIKEGVRELKKNPFQIILNQKRMLPKDHPYFIGNNYQTLKKLSKPSQRNPYHQSMQFTLTYYFKKIRGFDEEIKYMYGEDDDLIKRFLLFGLKIKTLYKKTSYLHQWHPKYQGKTLKDIEIKEQIKKNKERLKKEKSIIRNLKGLGIKK